MKMLFYAVITLIFSLAYAEEKPFNFSSMTLPVGKITLSQRDNVFFRTLIVSDGKILTDIFGLKIPDTSDLDIIKNNVNYCELQLVYSFYGETPKGDFTLPENSLNLQGTIKNAQTLNSLHCSHNADDIVRQKSLFTMNGTSGHGFFPSTIVNVGSHKLIFYAQAIFCDSYYPHSLLPAEDSFVGLENGFRKLIEFGSHE